MPISSHRNSIYNPEVGDKVIVAESQLFDLYLSPDDYFVDPAYPDCRLYMGEGVLSEVCGRRFVVTEVDMEDHTVKVEGGNWIPISMIDKI